MIRLMIAGMDVPPPPAIAPSIHVLSVLALNASAILVTAAASPPDVHQCVTSSSAAEADVAASRATDDNSFVVIFTILFSLI